MRTQPCRECGREFAHDRRYQWYCSPECSARAKSVRLGFTPRARTLEDKFWSSVDRGMADECWLNIGPRGARNAFAAHRVSYELHIGPIPAGLNILHSCDNPPCVNPAHLRAGTQADNGSDVSVRERSNTRKLTADQVAVIRQRIRSGASNATLAAEYGISAGNVQFIRSGKTWGHVA